MAGRKYFIYVVIAGWMFFLGVMTGRGTIPVKFDTVSFTDHLADIAARTFTKEKPGEKKVKFDFYKGLISDTLVIEPKKITKPEKLTAKISVKPQQSSKPKSSNRVVSGEKQLQIYTLQLAAYRNYDDAVKEITKLKKKGFQAYQEKTQNKGKTWYRVRLGSFPDRERAKTAKDRLSKTGVDSLIMKKE